VPAIHSELLARFGGELVDARFDPLLFVGLSDRHVLAVRDHPGGNGRAEGLSDIRPGTLRDLLRVEQSVVFFPLATGFVPFVDAHIVSPPMKSLVASQS
jgi:hypothetical protein